MMLTLEKHDTLDEIRKFLMNKYREGIIQYRGEFGGIKIYTSSILPPGQLLMFEGDRLVARIDGLGKS